MFQEALCSSTTSAAGLLSVYGQSWIDFVLYVLSFLCLFHFCDWTDSQNDLYWPSRARVVLNPTIFLWFPWFIFYYFISTSVFGSGTFPMQVTFTLYNWALFMELWNRRKVFQNMENEKKQNKHLKTNNFTMTFSLLLSFGLLATEHWICKSVTNEELYQSKLIIE